MNSETMEIIDGYVRETGASIRCPVCSTYEVWADDPDAEKMVYAMVTNAWKRGEFRADGREGIMSLVKQALDNLNIDCPGCGGR